MKKIQELNKRVILSAFCSCVITAVVFSGVLFAVLPQALRYVKGDKPEQKIYVEVSSDPNYPQTEIRETERVIVTNSSGTLTQYDQSVTLQDYKRGLQATKDVTRHLCLVYPTNVNFETAVEMIRKNQEHLSVRKQTVFVNMTASKEPIPPTLLKFAVGENISQLCHEVETRWLLESTEDLHRRSKRDSTLTFTVGDNIVIVITIKPLVLAVLPSED